MLQSTSWVSVLHIYKKLSGNENAMCILKAGVLKMWRHSIKPLASQWDQCETVGVRPLTSGQNWCYICYSYFCQPAFFHLNEIKRWVRSWLFFIESKNIFVLCINNFYGHKIFSMVYKCSWRLILLGTAALHDAVHYTKCSLAELSLNHMHACGISIGWTYPNSRMH